MGALGDIKVAKDRKELARLLGYKPSALTAIVYKTPTESKYTEFDIPKKSGGVRKIKAPTLKLKKLQSHLAHFLYRCLYEIEQDRKTNVVSFGFRKSKSITNNARQHKKRRYVLNLDLKDFFPSFNFGRVRGYFLKDRNFELNEEVATTLAQIACDGVALPQGSPCSPVISELIGQILDIRLLRLAKKHGVRYSRYADDITFSTNQKNFPQAIAKQESINPEVWYLGDELINKIKNSGFEINAAKTRMSYRTSRQTVTGLVVNQKVNVKSDYYRKARAMCHSLFETGQYFSSTTLNKESEKPEPDLTSDLNRLEGILNHIYRVTKTKEKHNMQDQCQHPRVVRTLYRPFLFYKNCIALDKPLIITEGKTDPIYLANAIKFSPKFQPALGKSGENGFEYNLRFFNYENKSHDIMGLGGGSGDLKSIPLDYQRNLLGSGKPKRSVFSHKPMKFPVILVLDNDGGLDGVASTISSIFKIKISKDTRDDFYHIYENLYMVKVLEGDKDTCIEHLFNRKLLETEIKGKKFELVNEGDVQKGYSKEVFAKQIVAKKADEIDFSGFEPLLERLQKAIEDYANSKKTT